MIDNDALKYFYIPKGYNSFRKIVTYGNNTSGLKLKQNHKMMNDILIKNISFSKFTKAYVKESSIIKNAKCHLYNNTFIQIDIKNFFQSINHHKLLNILFFEINKNKHYFIPKEDCLKFLNTCYCSSKGLPIGLVISPTLANIYMKSFDNILYSKLKEIGLENVIYTRYADDIVISYKNKLDKKDIYKIKEIVEKQLKFLGLKINEKKFRYVSLYTSNHVKITSINICKVKMNENDNYRYLTVGRNKRELIYKLALNLLECDEKDSFYQHKLKKLKGYYAYVYSVEGDKIELLCPPLFKEKIKLYGFENIKVLIESL